MAIGRPYSLTPNVASKTVAVIATEGQTSFSPTGGYMIGEIAVYRNGVKLVQDRDFTANDGVVVTLVSGATEDDVVSFQIFDAFNVDNTIRPNESAQTINGDLTITGTLTGGGLPSVSPGQWGKTAAGINTSVSVGIGTTRPDSIARVNNTSILNAGIVTAYELYGDGSNLSNVSYAGTATVPGISTQLHSVFGTINASGIVTASALTATNSSTLSGGIVVGTAASVHSPGTNFLSLGTNNVGVVSITAQSGVLFKNGLLVERVDRNTSAAANAATALNMDNGMIHWFTTNLGAANVKMNLTSAVGINSTLAVGDMISVTIMTKVNSSSNFIEQLRVDGVEASAGVTTYWTGGSAPTDGGGSGVDTYLFNIVKTGSGTYDMVANQVKGS